LTSTRMPRDSQLSSSAILTSRASKDGVGRFLSIPGVLDCGGSNCQLQLPRSQSALVVAGPGSFRSPYPNRCARAILAQVGAGVTCQLVRSAQVRLVSHATPE
jgi:hypothetical protein